MFSRHPGEWRTIKSQKRKIYYRDVKMLGNNKTIIVRVAPSNGVKSVTSTNA